MTEISTFESCHEHPSPGARPALPRAFQPSSRTGAPAPGKSPIIPLALGRAKETRRTRQGGRRWKCSGKREEKEEEERARKRGSTWVATSVWKSVDRWEGGMFGGGPTALVAVERTNFVLIEKSPALNPIYKPANMAGVGRSLARSSHPRLTAPSARIPIHNCAGIWASHAPRILDKGFQGGSPRRRRGAVGEKGKDGATTAVWSFHTWLRGRGREGVCQEEMLTFVGVTNSKYH